MGCTLIKALSGSNAEIRGLILPDEEAESSDSVTYYKGDVRDIDSMRPIFEGIDCENTYLIHTAGIVAIENKVSPFIYGVNVLGTRNVIALCREYKVKRLVYVSSVHAIPEKPDVLSEITAFSPEKVEGGYAKTKAEATQAVLDAAKDGLNAVVVHPSGIIGPYGNSRNYLVQLISDYLKGVLPACVKGGYDFVDVRDVAKGCLLAAEKGVSGECYILSNRRYEIKDILKIVRNFAGGKRLPVLPVWIAKAAEPLLQFIAKCKKTRPLYTKYSLSTITSKVKFSHEKADKELGYSPCELSKSVIDTVKWLTRQNKAAL